MSSTKWRALYDEPTVETVDTTPEVKVEDFDPAAFIKGIRPYREAALLYPRGDLIPRMRDLGGQISAIPEGTKSATLDDLIDQFDALRTEYEAAGRWWEIESRSGEWVREARRKSAKRRGIDLAEDDVADVGQASGDVSEDDREAILLDQLAQQIVVPGDVTRDMLGEMVKVAQAEVNKLLVAMGFANSRASQNADVFTRDFSQRRSGNRGQRRSAPRSK